MKFENNEKNENNKSNGNLDESAPKNQEISLKMSKIFSKKENIKSQKLKRKIFKKKTREQKYDKAFNNLAQNNVNLEFNNSKHELPGESENDLSQNKVNLFLRQKKPSFVLRGTFILGLLGIPTISYIVFMIIMFTDISKEINETIEEASMMTQVGTRAR